MRGFIPLIVLLFVQPAYAQFERITFSASDGLEVTADLYRTNDSPIAPTILLFHQAGSSRGEYRPIAPHLNRLGFNCLAVDLRSGSTSQGVSNETAFRAQQNGFSTTFLEAQKDLEAAVAEARRSYATGPLILWGSSYSSSLVIKLAGEQPAIADAVISFSPGEYFDPNNLIATAASGVQIPTFITSAQNETNSWKTIFEAISAEGKTSYVPPTGRHGSSSLWPETSDYTVTWDAVTQFLNPWAQTSPPIISFSRNEESERLINLAGVSGQAYRVLVSRDLRSWVPMMSFQADDEPQQYALGSKPVSSPVFYRTEPIIRADDASVTNVTVTGSPGAYTFNVTIESSDLGCDQYADWWEVVRNDGSLAYRRILAHSHITEQPFTRSGGPVNVAENEFVTVRVHWTNHFRRVSKWPSFARGRISVFCWRECHDRSSARVLCFLGSRTLDHFLTGTSYQETQLYLEAAM